MFGSPKQDKLIANVIICPIKLYKWSTLWLFIVGTRNAYPLGELKLTVKIRAYKPNVLQKSDVMTNKFVMFLAHDLYFAVEILFKIVNLTETIVFFCIAIEIRFAMPVGWKINEI